MADQRYVIDESVQPRYVGQRDVATFPPFLVPHLNPGIDVGCEVGAIAFDVAARASAAERGADNTRIEVGSAYELPVGDARIFAREGGDTRHSSNLRGLMLDAGFARTRGVAHAPKTYGEVA